MEKPCVIVKLLHSVFVFSIQFSDFYLGLVHNNNNDNNNNIMIMTTATIIIIVIGIIIV